MSAFQFGQSVAQFVKHADAMHDKYQASGHAGTMSYDDFLEAHDNGPSAPQPPAAIPSPTQPAAPQPVGAPAGNKPGFFSRLGSRVGQGVDTAIHYSPPMVAGRAIGAGIGKLTAGAKQLYQWGTTPIGQLYPDTFGPKPPAPSNPQWESQRQNYEGSMF